MSGRKKMPAARLAEQLRHARERHGHSIEHVARLVGVSARTIWRWEHGKNKPQGLQHEALQRYLRDLTGPDKPPILGRADE